MIVDVDLTKTREAATDLVALQRLLHALIGHRCYKIDLNYGDELMLHIGNPIPYDNAKLDEMKGEWILGTRASGWRLLLNTPPSMIEVGWLPEVAPAEIFSDHRIENQQVEELAKGIANTTINDIRILHWRLPTPIGVGLGLVVEFSNGASLVIVPSPETDLGEDPIADWELFTPFKMYLKVGPGRVWSYLPSEEIAH